MFAQRFGPRGRRLTNFPYYYNHYIQSPQMHIRNFHSSVLTFCYFSPVFTKTVILSSYILQITQWTNICDLFNGKKTNQICNNLTGQLSSTGPHCRYSPSAALYTAYTALQQHFTLQIQPFNSTPHCIYSPSAALSGGSLASKVHNYNSWHIIAAYLSHAVLA